MVYGKEMLYLNNSQINDNYKKITWHDTHYWKNIYKSDNIK